MVVCVGKSCRFRWLCLGYSGYSSYFGAAWTADMGAVAQSCREDDVGVARWSSMWGSAVKYSRRRCEVADVVFGVWKMGKRTGWCSRGRYGEADVVFGAVWTEDMNVSQSVYIRTRRSVRSLLKVHAVGISLTHHVMQSSFCGTEMHLHSCGGRIFYPPRDRLFPRHVS